MHLSFLLTHIWQVLGMSGVIDPFQLVERVMVAVAKAPKVVTLQITLPCVPAIPFCPLVACATILDPSSSSNVGPLTKLIKYDP